MAKTTLKKNNETDDEDDTYKEVQTSHTDTDQSKQQNPRWK